MTKKKPGAIRGRPPEGGKTPPRQLGRVSEDDWQQLQDAAKASRKTFTEWAVAILLRAAKRQRVE